MLSELLLPHVTCYRFVTDGSVVPDIVEVAVFVVVIMVVMLLLVLSLAAVAGHSDQRDVRVVRLELTHWSRCL